MKLIYLTSKRFPATTADHFFIKEMARAFTRIMGQDFLLTVSANSGRDLDGIPNEILGLNIMRGIGLWFRFRIPFFILRHGLNRDDAVFFSNDQVLLRIVIFWKKIFHLKYFVASEWHMLFEQGKDSAVCRESDLVFATSSNLKNIMVRDRAVPGSKIKVAYGGVDLSSFRAGSDRNILRKELGLPESGILVGYVGLYRTMGMGKGLDTMIKALADITDTRVNMVFVGGKPDEISEYRQIAEVAGLSSRVVFVPMVSADQVPLYEMAMDILVIPYPDRPHFREYGFPMKAYEYMASGRPIVYSNLPIIAEMLGDCASSFKPEDAGDLASKIDRLLKNPEESRSLAEKARLKVERFTWDKRAAGIIDFIKSSGRSKFWPGS